MKDARKLDFFLPSKTMKQKKQNKIALASLPAHCHAEDFTPALYIRALEQHDLRKKKRKNKKSNRNGDDHNCEAKAF